jgi:hypothetical protein
VLTHLKEKQIILLSSKIFRRELEIGGIEIGESGRRRSE